MADEARRDDERNVRELLDTVRARRSAAGVRRDDVGWRAWERVEFDVIEVLVADNGGDFL